MADIKIDDTVDITDVVCPVTFVKAKVALEELDDGQILAIKMNDGEPVQNVPRSVKEEGHQILKLEDNEDGTYTLIVRKVEDTIREKKLTEPKGKFASRNWLQTHTLLDTIEEFKFDACIGGARRDEEKARAKERFFSVRDDFGQWEPKLQRPELWNIYNGRIHKGENVRVFPISNWTELDVWNYIKKEKIQLPSIYFAHQRDVIEYEGQLIAVSDFIQIDENDTIINKKVRYRTVGDMTCTAAVESHAATLDDVVNEITASRISERGETRIDDKVTEAAMEDRKKGGYF